MSFTLVRFTRVGGGRWHTNPSCGITVGCASGSPCSPGHASDLSSGAHHKMGYPCIVCRSASSVPHYKNHLQGENSRSCFGEHSTTHTGVKRLNCGFCRSCPSDLFWLFPQYFF